MKRMMQFLHGENPGTAQLALNYAVAAAGLIAGIAAGDTLIQKAVLGFIAADWLGGIVANSTRSTRVFYAGLAPKWAVIFVLGHVVEAALLVLIFGADVFPVWLWLILAAKMAVFIVGQVEERSARRLA